MNKLKKRIEENKEYNKQTYDRIEITVLKGRRELIKKRADILDKSVNKYIKDLIDQDMGGIINEGQYEFLEKKEK